LKFATPATVSRAGVLYINEYDIGYTPFINSWLERSHEELKQRKGKIVLNAPLVPEID